MNGTHQPSPAPPAAAATDSTADAAPRREGRGKRSARDWTVDSTAFLLAAAFSFLTAEPVVEDPALTDLALFTDLVLGVLACTALWWRRRWPVPLVVVLLLLSTVSHFVVGPTLVAMFTVAVHRPFRPVVAIGGLSLACGLLTSLVHTDPNLGYLGSVLMGAVLHSTMIGWGMFVRSRRQLVISLRERAHRAESEAALRAERAQRLTRERIAREMHDVLAHRLSLLSVHAGALEYRPDAPPQDIAQAAGVIRASAHQALEDLREVIGVLRAPIGPPPAGASAEPSAPGAGSQPGAGGAVVAADTGANARRWAVRRGRGKRGAPGAGDGGAGGGTGSAVGGGTGGVAGGGTSGGLGGGAGAGAGGVAGAVSNGTGSPQRAPSAALAVDEPRDTAVPSRPQPTLADLLRLVEESRQAAMHVSLHDERDESGRVPAATGRTAYRIVQEGLTNARKHAPGSAVTVRVTGAPERGLAVEVRDRPRADGGERRAPAIPGSGQGLLGLAERASLAGGHLESGATEDGGFLLRAWLPWPS